MNPRMVGAAVPSSKSLAMEMASHVSVETSGLVIEVGSGTGVVTEALLTRGVSSSRIIAVEYVPALAKKLQKRFPKIRVITGNAANLGELLGESALGIDAIVSSLPLRSLPKDTRDNFFLQLSHLLPLGAKYIQFTYSYRKNNFEALNRYRVLDSKRVWCNVPPARVDVFSYE